MEDPYRNRNPQPNPQQQQEQEPPPSFCFCLCKITFLFILILFLIWSILDYVNKPRHPEFYVDSISLSNYNFNPPHNLNASLNVRFRVFNPNKSKKRNVSFSNLASSLFYQDYYLLSETRIQPFQVSPRNSTTVAVSFAINIDSNVDGRVVEGINRDMSTGHLIFSVKVGGMVSYMNASQISETVEIVSCPDLALSVSSGSGAKKCTLAHASE